MIGRVSSAFLTISGVVSGGLMQSQSIAIIGAGTAGLASAALLAQQGHQITLLERAEALAPVGAGLLLQPTGLGVLKSMGLYDAMCEHGARVDALVGHNHRGQLLMNTAYSALGEQSHGLGIHRASLCTVLDQHLQQFPYNREMGCEVREVIQGGDVVVLEVIRQGEHRRLRFDAVLVANGSHSTLRPASWVRYDRLYPWGAMWAMVPALETFAEPLLQQRYRYASQMAGLLPTGSQPDLPDKPLLSFFWSLPVSEMEHWRAADFAFDQWREQVHSLWPQLEPVLAPLTSAGQLLPAVYRDVIMTRWGEGRLGVIGDAAHAMSPQLGQGANMALLDAHALADVISSAAKWEQVWPRYHQRRAPQIRFYQRMSRWLTPAFQSHGKWVAGARDVLFPMMQAVPWFRSQMTRTVAGLKTGLLSDTA